MTRFLTCSVVALTSRERLDAVHAHFGAGVDGAALLYFAGAVVALVLFLVLCRWRQARRAAS